MEAMEATNAARANHGEKLADILDSGGLKAAMQHASRHPKSHRGTTHVSVIDADGNAASASVSNGEGNGQIVGRFGFMLNNMLGEEDLMPDGLGNWRENVRLSSMMAPDHHSWAGRRRHRARRPAARTASAPRSCKSR